MLKWLEIFLRSGKVVGMVLRFILYPTFGALSIFSFWTCFSHDAFPIPIRFLLIISGFVSAAMSILAYACAELFESSTEIIYRLIMKEHGG